MFSGNRRIPQSAENCEHPMVFTPERVSKLPIRDSRFNQSTPLINFAVTIYNRSNMIVPAEDTYFLSH